MTKRPFQQTVSGQPVIFLDSVASTNDYAKSRVADFNQNDFTIILADEQTGGRGRRENYWYSESGRDLTFSILASGLSLPIHQRFYLNQLVSLSIIHCLEPFALNGSFSIKWPNDIFYEGKKIGGILIENILQGEIIETSIIGIGLNIGQKNNPYGGVSLSQVSQLDYSREDLFEKICLKIVGSVKVGFKEKSDLSNLEYQARLFGIGKELNFTFLNERMEGIFKGVNKNGEAVIETLPDGGLLSSENFDELRFK